MVDTPDSGMGVSPSEQAGPVGETAPHEGDPPSAPPTPTGPADTSAPDDGAAVTSAPDDGAADKPAPDDGAAARPVAGPALSVAAVARRLGVAPATLRTWDRRYGLGPSERMAGSHRRYSSGDVTRLLVMRRLTLEGVAPSDAARAALTAPEGLAPEFHVPSASEVMDAYARAEPMAADPAGLAAAASSFDNAAMRWMLTRVHPRDVLAWWADFVQPALALLAGRAAVLRPGEGAGAALTAGAFAELRSRAVAATAQRESTAGSPVTVVLIPTGAPDHLHLHVLATALQSGGVRVRLLAWSDPGELSVAVGRLAPAAVVIDLAAPDARPVALGPLVEATRGLAGDLPVFVHQEGGAALDLPMSAHVHRVRTMTGALHEVLAVV